MKYVVILPSLLFFLLLLFQPSYSQTLQQIWAVAGDAYFVGDLDGDGVGEVVIQSSTSLTFFDGATHSLKWTVSKTSSEYLYKKFSVFRDYNDNGVSDIIIMQSTGTGADVSLRIVDPSSNTTLFTKVFHYDVFINYFDDYITLANVNGGSTLELVVKNGTDSLFVYATNLNSTGASKSLTPLPNQFQLNQNYPNPFNPNTVIDYSLPKSGSVKLEVFDGIGRLVRTLDVQSQTAGQHQVIFDGRDASGSLLATGAYYYRLVFDGAAQAKKMLLMK